MSKPRYRCVHCGKTYRVKGHNCGRFGKLLEVHNVQVKRVNGHAVRITHSSKKQADREIASERDSEYWKVWGRRFRFRYRINVYEKRHD